MPPGDFEARFGFEAESWKVPLKLLQMPYSERMHLCETCFWTH